eukprot:17109-Eustigmatos_ZCMA.PRE.1
MRLETLRTQTSGGVLDRQPSACTVTSRRLKRNPSPCHVQYPPIARQSYSATVQSRRQQQTEVDMRDV